MDTRQVVARFEAERQALALMDHPNIARVLDGGATENGRPYFVMELVQGVPITEFCDKNQFLVEERLKLFVLVCQAIQSAHQKGIIHRDLKPTNILVALNPDGSGMPKVIDFGVAKAINQTLTEKTLFTNHAAMIGTPAYMSPEQAEMSNLDVDTRVDIYGLGVLLYELLTGTTPFSEQRLRSAGYNEMQRIILQEEPERPSTRLSTLQGEQRSAVARNRGAAETTLGRGFPSDLDWVVMKCLEKDRARRYETANGLARDLERLLQNEPVVARPPSAAYRFRKFLRRNKLAVSATAAVALALVLGAVVSTWEAIRATQLKREARSGEQRALAAQAKEAQQRGRAETSEQAGQRLLYAARMRLAQAAWEQNRVGRVRQILDETAAYTERGFEWYYWQRQTHLELVTLCGHLDSVSGVAFSPDGRRVATASYDRTAKVWDAYTGAELLTITGHLAAVSCVAFSPDGRRIVTGSVDATAKVWDLANGSNLLTLKGHRADVNTVAFSRDGRRILTGSDDHTAKVWDALSGTNLLTLEGPCAVCESVAFSPDGRRIAIGREDHTIKVFDATSGTNLLTLTGHQGRIQGVIFSTDGQLILSGSEDQTAKVWEASTGRELFTLKGPVTQIAYVAFSPDGRRIATAGYDHTAKIWDARADRETPTLRGHTSLVLSVAFSPQGERMVTESAEGTAKVWETASGKRLLNLEAHATTRAVAFSPIGQWIVTASQETLSLWNATSGEKLFAFTAHSGPITSVAFSPEGQQLVTAGTDQTAKVWDIATRACILTLQGHNGAVFGVAFSPDGKRIATASNDHTARVWDAASGRPLLILTLEGHDEGLSSVAFSPNGRQILTGSWNGTTRLWDAISGTNLLTLQGHDGHVRRVAFSPDGRRVVTASDDRTAKVWDAISGEELLTLKGHTDVVYGLACSPDGRRIATGSADQTAKVWQAASAAEVALWQKQENDASERLAALGRERGDALENERLLRLQDPGTIKQWLVLAPLRFTNQSASAALDCEQFADEPHLHPLASERIHVGEGEQTWRPVGLYNPMLDFTVIDAERLPGSLAYAVCYIYSETNQPDLLLKVGSSDESKVYLNGKEIYRWSEPRTYVPDQDVVTGVELQKGRNVLLFKLATEVEEATDFNWQASIRFTDAAGQEVKGIRATITPASEADLGAIHDWLLLAPIRFDGTNGSMALAQEQIPGEAHLRPRTGDRSQVGETNLVWQELHLDEYGLDFLELTGRTNADWSVAYAVCYIESQANQTNLIMKVGSDDQAKVYLNNKEIYRYDGLGRALVPDQDEVREVELRAGVNTLVFKVVNERLGWGGTIRFTDALGVPVKGIRVTLVPP